MLKIQRMKAELNELRYCLEQNVERRTKHLQGRIALLESCNATLCGKLASAQKELAVLRSVRLTAGEKPLAVDLNIDNAK